MSRQIRLAHKRLPALLVRADVCSGAVRIMRQQMRIVVPYATKVFAAVLLRTCEQRIRALRELAAFSRL